MKHNLKTAWLCYDEPSDEMDKLDRITTWLKNFEKELVQRKQNFKVSLKEVGENSGSAYALRGHIVEIDEILGDLQIYKEDPQK